MISQKTTYYLGAGASCQALPLAAKLQEDILNFIDVFNPFMGSSFGPKIKFSKEVYKRYLDSLDGIDGYPSIDTYAKALHVRQDKSKLETFTEILNIYLVFKQFNWTSILGNSSQYHSDKFKLSFKGLQDSRYLGLISKLYSNNEINDYVSIVSWNYDIQLELAIMKFLDLDYCAVCDRLKTYPHDHKGAYSVDRKSPRIVKLNGTTGLWIDKDRSAYSQLIHGNPVLKSNLDLPQLFQFADQGDYLQSTVGFAWDQSVMQQYALASANRLICETETLVVIGYSFPDFNWEIDRAVFFNNNVKEVFIQVPEADYKHYAAKVKNLVNPNTRIEHVGLLNEFYLPIHNKKNETQFLGAMKMIRN